MSSRRTYTREFKVEAAQLSYNSDKPVSEIAVKDQFIEAHREQYPVRLMGRVLDIARSGYYAWPKQPLSARKMADLLLLMYNIRDVFEQSRQTYGSYRIRATLVEQGLRCGRKRVARLILPADYRLGHQRQPASSIGH